MALTKPRVVVHESLTDVTSADDQLVNVDRCLTVGECASEEGVTCQCSQRRGLRRLPDDGVAAHESNGGIPRPHRDGKVERGDDSDNAERVPRFRQPVSGTLGRHGASVELPGETDGELADVDHLLYLAESLRGDLPGLQRHDFREVILVLGQ